MNPAKIADVKNPEFNLFYRNYYGIKGLDQIGFDTQFNIAGWPLAFGFSRYGDALYAENELRLGSALELIDGLSLGLSINSYFVFIKNYGNSNSAGFSLALLYSVTENLKAAFVVDNLNEPEIGQAKEKIPAHMALGMAFQAAQNMEFFLDIVKEESHDFDVHVGLAYYFNDQLSIRAGFRNYVGTFNSGLFFNMNKFTLGYAFEYHMQLGLSNSLSFGYAF